MPPTTRIHTDTARVLRARIGADVVADALDVAHVANACAPFVPALWTRDRAPLGAWMFTVGNVHYIPEDSDQFIRTPWRTVADGFGDCKSTAILIACLCAACGCDVVLRFIVHPGESDWGHVYAVADGVAVDPLLAFGEEMPYVCRHDVPVAVHG